MAMVELLRVDAAALQRQLVRRRYHVIGRLGNRRKQRARRQLQVGRVVRSQVTRHRVTRLARRAPVALIRVLVHFVIAIPVRFAVRLVELINQATIRAVSLTTNKVPHATGVIHTTGPRVRIRNHNSTTTLPQPENETNNTH